MLSYELTEILKCPACGNEDVVRVFSKDEFRGMRCKICNLVYITPRIKNLQVVYNDDCTSSPAKYYKASACADNITFTRRLSLLEKYANKGSLLDVGCTVGTLLKVARNRGWLTLLGVEPNPCAAEAVCKEHIDIVNDFFTLKLSRSWENKFDAVCLGDVIEHVDNPNELLQGAFTALKSSGVVMVTTPDYESWVARKLQIKPQEHILYFTGDSLAGLLVRNGFKVILTQKTTRERSLRAMIYSTTIKSFLGKILVRLLCITRVNILLELIIRSFVKDEILIIAKKGVVCI